ncbi:MAG: hypothetical protein Q7S33_06030 [Nanoarchaeota archaeon]|nr:hypothetical protein [Nanoarchaeota archaeon]
MKFPEKYTKHGEFKLHSGETSNILYDVNALLTDNFYVGEILSKIPSCPHYIGIATGGAIVASLISRERKSLFSMIKDRELKGKFPLTDWILIDDVITTGSSLEEAINIIGKIPSKIVVIFDRRAKNKELEVYSIFEK